MNKTVNLAGTTVMVTRPVEPFPSWDPLIDRLVNCQARVISHPVIELTRPENDSQIEAAIRSLEQYEWVVFLSRAGVLFLKQFLEDNGGQLSQIGSAKIAAIGAGTALALEDCGLNVDLVPDEPSSRGLGAALVEKTMGPILFFRANRGSDEIAQMLHHARRKFEEVVVYESRDVAAVDPQVLQQLADGKFDWVTITSSAIARSAIRLFGSALHQTKLVSIGPSVSKELERSGFKVAVDSEYASFESLVASLFPKGPATNATVE